MLLLLTLAYGSRANDQYVVHEAILLRLKFAMRELQAELSPYHGNKVDMNAKADREMITRACDLVDSTIECLAVEDRRHPVTILGVRASGAILRTAAVAGATVLSSAARLLFN